MHGISAGMAYTISSTLLKDKTLTVKSEIKDAPNYKPPPDYRPHHIAK